MKFWSKDGHLKSKSYHTLNSATTAPTWPLPCDWKWAGDAEAPPASPNNPNPSVQCKYCTQWLSVPPNDAANSIRRHIKGIKCKRGREVVEMNRLGYHVLSEQDPHTTFYRDVLSPFIKEGKHYAYYPAPIVSLVRWRRQQSAYSNPNFTKELTDFLSWDEATQIGYLCGFILKHEFEEEDRKDEPRFRSL